MTPCPKCGAENPYITTRQKFILRFRCRECGVDFTSRSNTLMRHGKKPDEWYEQIIALYKAGVPRHRIAVEIGTDPKSVYVFLAKWIEENGKVESEVRRVDSRNLERFLRRRDRTADERGDYEVLQAASDIQSRDGPAV